MKQKTLRVFEVEDFDKLKNIVENKYELIKNHYFMLKVSDKEIQDYLREKGLNFFVLNSDNSFNIQKEIVEIVKVVEKEVEKEVLQNLKIFERIIRSGEEIETTSAVFLKKINPGAKVKVVGDAIFLDENRGNIIVDGNFLYVKKNRGNIVYNSEDIGLIERDTIFYNNKRLELWDKEQYKNQ